VAVLDVRLPDGSGIDLCRDLLSAHPGLHCLMLTAFDDDEANYAAVLAGASGYVLKDIRASGLVDGVRKVAAGRSLVGASVPARVVETLSRPTADPTSGLTLRERQVLELIAEGLTNREIGERLGLAEKTIKNYVSALFAKLGLVRRTQAAVFGATKKP
jgi:DNA-binding NarL/FixJ family response regulator